jgi:hypothetical protein
MTTRIVPKLGAGLQSVPDKKGRGCDHRHYRNRITWYDFKSASQLIEDFWADVRALMKEEGVPWQ